MKFAFSGQFVQVTAESVEESTKLLSLQGEITKKRKPYKLTNKGREARKQAWETRRAKYGKNGMKFATTKSTSAPSDSSTQPVRIPVQHV